MSDVLATEFLLLQEVLAGRFSIERELGRGGMGVVLLARDVALDRPVAIKVLPGTLSTDTVTRDRFLREARTAAGLSHPNIVPIHLVEEHGNVVFFVMGYVDGETLRERVMRSGPLSPRLVARAFQEVSWALGYAHQRGVIHRDVKPDNIMIERGTERAIVMDFGIAHTERYTSDAAEVIGTARYMSPEQAAGEPVDPRSDLYSLGATAFFALTGRAPFEARNVPALLAKHVTEPAPALLSVRAELPKPLAEAVDRCLAKRPADRFPSGEDLANAFDAVRGRELRAPPLIRGFVRNAQVSTMILLTLAVASQSMVSWANGNLSMNLGGVIIGGVVVTQLIAGARQLLREGYVWPDIHQALLAEAQLQAEEADVVGTKRWVRRIDSLWTRMWAGRFGRWFFATVGTGVRPTGRRVIASSEPTELGLGRATQALFADLPADIRRRAGDLDQVLDTLERRAERLRARGAAGPELTNTIAAMENVRVALLRLQAGAGSTDDLTRALERARAIGAAVDRRLDVS